MVWGWASRDTDPDERCACDEGQGIEKEPSLGADEGDEHTTDGETTEVECLERDRSKGLTSRE